MLANNTGRMARHLLERYPHHTGQMFAPAGIRKPIDGVPYALDNGCFTNWDPRLFVQMLEKVSKFFHQPLWVVVPDVVGDWDQTIMRWQHWAPWIKDKFGFQLAMALQDKAGRDLWKLRVDPMPDVYFVGGSTRWKWETAYWWCQNAPRVHIGRVNSPKRLWQAMEWGAESCDGTGWFRGDRRQRLGLVQFLRQNKPDRFRTLFDDYSPLEA